MAKYSELGALERFLKLGEIHAKAELLIEAASVFHVDHIFAGIQDFFRDQGVPEGDFLVKLQAKVQAKKDANTKNVNAVFEALASLPRN